MFRYWVVMVTIAFWGTGLFSGNTIANRVVPHLAADSGGYETKIQIYNSSRQSKTIQLLPYNQKGEPSTAISFTLGPRETREISAQQWLPQASHFFVLGSERVQVSVSFQSKEDQAATAYLLEQPVGVTSYLAYSAAQQPSVPIWEGFAVVNASVHQNQVTVEQINLVGDVLGEVDFLMAPGAKRVWVNSEFLPVDASDVHAIRVRANHAISLMSLAGINQGTALWNVVALPSFEYPNIIFSSKQPGELVEEPFKIINAQIAEELLYLDVEFSVDCAYEVDLVMSGGFMESTPVQVNVSAVYRIVPGHCNRQFARPQVTFDLNALAERYQDAYGTDGLIHINLFDAEGFVEQLVYNPF